MRCVCTERAKMRRLLAVELLCVRGVQVELMELWRWHTYGGGATESGVAHASRLVSLASLYAGEYLTTKRARTTKQKCKKVAHWRGIEPANGVT